MSIFKRKQKPADEPSLLDVDVAPSAGTASSTPAKKGILGSWSSSSARGLTPTADSDAISSGPRASALPTPLQPTLASSPRLSTSSRTSIFERSVDNLAVSGISPGTSVLSSPMSPTSLNNSTTVGGAAQSDGSQVSAAHQQFVIEQQIPAVLDASVEAIVSDTNLDNVEVVTAHVARPGVTTISATSSPPPTASDTGASSRALPGQMASSQIVAPPVQLPNPWTEEENPLTNPEIDQIRRLSFVSYADLVHVEQSEQAAKSRTASVSGQGNDPKAPSLLVQASTTDKARDGLLSQEGSANSRPVTAPGSAVQSLDPAFSRPRQRSIVTLGTVPPSADMEIRSSTMSDELLKPVVVSSALDSENPWAV